MGAESWEITGPDAPLLPTSSHLRLYRTLGTLSSERDYLGRFFKMSLGREQ